MFAAIVNLWQMESGELDVSFRVMFVLLLAKWLFASAIVHRQSTCFP
jgi:hypothetical protein